MERRCRGRSRKPHFANPILAACCAAACALPARGDETITGRIVDGSAAALAEARVWLKSRPDLADSTGPDGKFALTLAPTALAPSGNPSPGRPTLSWQGGRLTFGMPRAGEVAIDLIDARGRNAAPLFRGRKGPGLHSVAIDPGAWPAGACFLSFQGAGIRLPLPISAISGRGPSPEPDGDPAEAARLIPAKAAAVEDTLIVLRMGHEIRKTPLADLSSRDLGDIPLKPRSYRRDTAVAVKAGRRIEVYVPSDYAGLYKLPVLYLVHGRGANETYWRVNCKFLDSLNSFSDRSKVQPMIIVTPAAGGASNVGYYGKTADPFMADLTADIRGYVESHYKADTARMARAISGLSMGAIQTWNLTFFYPRLWGWSLPMSGGLHLSEGFSHAKLKADAASKAVDVAAINQLKLLKVYSNPTDIAFADTDTTSRLADTLGIRHEKDFTTKTPGGHTDPYWNEVFRKYAPLLFK